MLYEKCNKSKATTTLYEKFNIFKLIGNKTNYNMPFEVVDDDSD